MVLVSVVILVALLITSVRSAKRKPTLKLVLYSSSLAHLRVEPVYKLVATFYGMLRFKTVAARLKLFACNTRQSTW